MNVLMLGKGRRQRACPFGHKTTQALDRYLRVRGGHRDKARPEFWLGLAGPMTANGVADVVRRRGLAAGIADVHPHRFRHTFASDMVRAGISLPALMQLMGHSHISTTMIYVQISPRDVWEQYARAVAQQLRPIPLAPL